MRRQEPLAFYLTLPAPCHCAEHYRNSQHLFFLGFASIVQTNNAIIRGSEVWFCVLCEKIEHLDAYGKTAHRRKYLGG